MTFKKALLWSAGIVGGLALLVLPGFSVAAPDPYAASMRQAYERHKAEFMTEATAIYFADKCAVFGDAVAAQLVVGNLGDPLLLEATRAGIQPLPGPALLQEAARRGAEIAKTQGCGFWKTHPENVYQMRRLGQIAEGAR